MVNAAGIVYGLYLTLSSWVLFYVATHMDFFENRLHMASLNYTNQKLVPYCEGLLNGTPGTDPIINTME